MQYRIILQDKCTSMYQNNTISTSKVSLLSWARHLFLVLLCLMHCSEFGLSNWMLNPFTPTDNISRPNTMDGRVYSALKGFSFILYATFNIQNMSWWLIISLAFCYIKKIFDETDERCNFDCIVCTHQFYSTKLHWCQPTLYIKCHAN